MKISSIPQLYRNATRLKDIIYVLSKYGLAQSVSQLGLEFAEGWLTDQKGSKLSQYTFNERIRMVLTDLGPTFIKLGQILSTRPDLLGAELCEELQKLQSNVPADDPKTVRKTVEEELGQPIDEIFSEFDDKALASASIGQVHLATLKNDEKVVVKVQHDGIQSVVQEDLEILMSIAQIADKLPDFVHYQPLATVTEFKRSLERELDFGWEIRNLQLFQRNFGDDPLVKIPAPYTELSTARVLTMEIIDGKQLTTRKELEEYGFDLAGIAKHGAEIFIKMIFTYGVFHADPHPGNFFLIEGDIIGLIDFGMVGRLNEQLREGIEDMLISIVQRDPEQLTYVITQIGSIPRDVDTDGLMGDIEDFVAFYGNLPMEELNIGRALSEMMEIVHRYHIMLPAQIGLLIKVLITLEGTSRLLNPNFSLMEIIKPLQKDVVARRLSPERQLKKLRRTVQEISRIAQILPAQILQIVEQIQTGEFNFPLDHRGLETSVNRLVLGLLTSSLFLSSALLLGLKVPPFINWLPGTGKSPLSLFGLLGLLFSGFLGFRILRAIAKSGDLDEKR